MPTQQGLSWWKYIRNLFINAAVISIVIISLLITVSIAGEDYWDNPPVDVVSAEQPDIGLLCPGDQVLIHNIVTIEKPVVAIYYIGVMEEKRIFNVFGTQIIYNGFPHPIPGTFHQYFPWEVPELPPGRYYRSFAARGTDGSEQTVFIGTYFNIPQKERCKK